jgi:hypothetical protein
MPRPFKDKSWDELLVELRRLESMRDTNRGLRQALRELEVYQEEVHRQNLELMEAQCGLQASRDRYAELYDGAPVGYLTLARTGLVEEINLTAAALLGRPRQVLVGSPFVLHVHERDVFIAHLERLARGEAPVSTELSLRRRDGELVPVELHSGPARGASSGHLTAIHDLTERRSAEETQRRLEVREQVAREANAAKDRFLAVLSHELRTPLTAILAAVAVLEEDDDLPARTGPLLERIHRNVSVHARLVDDLLDVTRIGRGRVELRREPVDVHELIAQALEAFGDAPRVRTRLSATRSTLLADGVRLLQILSNLVRNAFAATLDTGTVSIETENVGDTMLRVTVRDDGVGITPERLERLFVPFQSDGDPGHPGRHGLGLGLALSRGLAEAHGGSLRAASEGPDKGATFTLELPVAGCPAKEAAPAIPRPRQVAAPLELLLVDDHEDSAASLALLLERRGYTVRVATTMQQALDAASAGFDVLVSDLALPDGSGRELLERLRADGDVRAVAMSGFGSTDDIERSLAAGFAAHLVKPFDPNRLVAAIEEAASGATPAAPQAPPSARKASGSGAASRGSAQRDARR